MIWGEAKEGSVMSKQSVDLHHNVAALKVILFAK